MKISKLIKLLEKYQREKGDISIFGNAPYYEPEYPVEQENIRFYEAGSLCKNFGNPRKEPILMIEPL